jgi:1-phosphatidylinositol phosphodiesterase
MGLTYFSASNAPWAPPQTVSLGGPGLQGVNSRVCEWLLDRLNDNTEDRTEKVRGWALMDFCDEDLVRLLVECNFKWRKHGEEGWI